jgi:kynurenine formamidase
MRVIDLTGPLHEGTQVYAGPFARHSWYDNIPYRIVQATCSYEKEGFCFHKIEMDTVAGTNVQAPAIFYEGSTVVEDIPLSTLVGEAVRLDIPKGAAADQTGTTNQEISAAELERALSKSKYKQGDILIIHTGWGDSPEIYAKWYTRSYVMCTPCLAVDAAKLLVERKARCVGSDMAILNTWKSTWDTHKTLLKAGIPVVNALISLNEVPSERFLFACMPLRMETHTSPVRAAAILL